MYACIRGRFEFSNEGRLDFLLIRVFRFVDDLNSEASFSQYREKKKGNEPFSENQFSRFQRICIYCYLHNECTYATKRFINI